MAYSSLQSLLRRRLRSRTPEKRKAFALSLPPLALFYFKGIILRRKLNIQGFYDILYVPFGYLFRILFSFVENYGLALVIFSVFFRVILLPSTIKQQKSSAKMTRLQPKLKRIKEKYQDYNPQERQQKIQQETSELYQREGYSSMGAGCLPLLIQFPVLIGLYGIIREPLTYVLDLSEAAITALTEAATNLGLIVGNAVAYAESIVISNIDKIVEAAPELLTKYSAEIETIRSFDFTVFGIDLGNIPSNVYSAMGISKESILILAVPVLSCLTSLLTSLLTQIRQKKANPNMENQQMMGCMMIMMPLWSLFLTWKFPVGMGMYWILSNLIAFLQTLILGYIYAPRKTMARLMVEETIERRSYENTKNKTDIANEISE
ncbi:MAG: YidC/Oxa1 family membrane protein insertase [Clostridia bacterium]|nr:YidC/Oxa1 family membrane protein insertase [Clostridia bacterium]